MAFALMSFARIILLEELQNHCMDAIRGYFRLRRAQQAIRIVTAEVVALAYDTVPELPELRLQVCLEAALQLRCKDIKELTDSADQDRDLFELVEQGGDFASTFTRLLLYHSKGQHYRVKAGSSLLAGYDCMYHVHHTCKTCKTCAGMVTNDEKTALIVGARGYLATKQTPTTSK
ncbi:MAG: hypothetical protein Q9226_008677 [Calogaya cf. arnoldii]